MCLYNIGTFENVEDKYTGSISIINNAHTDMRDFTKLNYLGYFQNKC